MDANTKLTYITFLTLFMCVLVSLGGLFFSLSVFMSTSNLHTGAFWCHILIIFGSFVSLTGIVLNFAGSMVLYVGFAILGLADVFCLVGVVVDTLTGSNVHSTDFSTCKFRPNNGTVACGAFVTGWQSFIKSCVILHNSNACICCHLFLEQDCKDQRSIQMLQRKAYLFEGVPSCEFVRDTVPHIHWVSGSICAMAFVAGVIALIALYSYRRIMNRVSGWSQLASINSEPSDDRNLDLIRAPRRVRVSSARVSTIHVDGPVVILTRGPTNGPRPAIPRSAPSLSPRTGPSD